MINTNDVVKLGVDTYKNRVEKFSQKEALRAMREALVVANGGSTKLTPKSLRGANGAAVFSIIEDILSLVVVDELQNDEFVNSVVDFRNLKTGDKNEFIVENSDLFTVSKLADGTQGLRRQRLGGTSKVSINTEVRGIKFYEELVRVMGGAIDFNTLIDRCVASMKHQILTDIYTLWNGVTDTDLGGTSYFPAAGAFDADVFFGVLDHVEAAANGKKATVIGTASAIRKLEGLEKSSKAQDDLYNLGYVGSYFARPVVAVPQKHKAGTSTFLTDSNVLTLIAGDEKPIKLVYEGDGLIIEGDRLGNADLTQDYLYAESYGIGLVVASGTGVGKYDMTE